MADVDYDDYDDRYAPPPFEGDVGHDAYYAPAPRFRLQRLVNIGGAAASVGLVIWLAVWGYDSAVRSARGVPVIHAEKGPWRIAPIDPGGSVAENQGLAVNNVAAVGVAAPPPDRLMLAPRPMELAPDDVAGLTNLAPAAPADPLAAPLADAPVTGAPPAADPLAPVAAGTALTAPDLAAPNPQATAQPAVQEDAVAAALAEALDPAADEALLDETAPAEDNAAPDGPLRPRARPEGLAAGSDALALSTDPNAAPVTEIDPATLTEGTRLAQMGAFDTPEEARAEWSKFATRYADLIMGKSMVVQSAESGGRTFYRLRAAGFDGEDASRDFCTKIVERGGSCIPVIHR